MKSANKNFSTLNNDYELSANQDTQFTLCTDAEASDIPVVSYEFVEIANIEVAEKDRIIGKPYIWYTFNNSDYD